MDELRNICFNLLLQLRVNDDKMCIIGNAVLSQEVMFPDSEDILSATKVIVYNYIASIQVS